ncbi:hypothetical protein RR48_05854 [Papilio machaon]|uniref:Uncharacterized protein n=1 Tax=Papilio machaon TaxID=76193 RepID=A0A0N1INS3_PAPMA|nr:hypothetical protein RR48_05854 [Papilio machaon]
MVELERRGPAPRVMSCTVPTPHRHLAYIVALPERRAGRHDRRELTGPEARIPGTRVISYFQGSSFAATIATIFCTSFLDKGSQETHVGVVTPRRVVSRRGDSGAAAGLPQSRAGTSCRARRGAPPHLR